MTEVKLAKSVKKTVHDMFQGLWMLSGGIFSLFQDLVASRVVVCRRGCGFTSIAWGFAM